MDTINATGYRYGIPHLAAIHKGFFAAEDLEVTFHRTTFVPDHNKGMAEGRWDLTLSSADTMIARTTTDGTDYVLFMQAEEGLAASLIGQAGIKSIEELRGKSLAGDPGDSNLDLIRKKILRNHGIDDTEYEVEIIGTSPKRLEALLEGRVVAAMLTPPSSEKAFAAGGELLADSADYVPNWPLLCGWALRSWAESNRELVVRFIRAWVAATDWALEAKNHDEAIRLMMDKQNLPRDRAEFSYSRIVPKARVNPIAIQTVIDLRAEMDVYPPPHEPPKRFYDISYWCEATGLPAP